MGAKASGSGAIMHGGIWRSFFQGLLPAALVALFVLFAPHASRAETIQDKSFDDWRTLVHRSDKTVFVTYSADPQERNMEMHVYKYAGECGTVNVVLFDFLSSPNSKDWSEKDIQGEMRVDQFPVHKTLTNGSAKSGEKKAVFSVHTFGNPGTVLQEMNQGQTVRFRFKIGGQEFYYRFSLKGFPAALERLSALCAQSGQAKAAKPKGEPGQAKAPGKSDSDFFESPKKPAGKTQKSDKDYF